MLPQPTMPIPTLSKTPPPRRPAALPERHCMTKSKTNLATKAIGAKEQAVSTALP